MHITSRALACLVLLAVFCVSCSLPRANVQPTINVATRAAQTVAAVQASGPAPTATNTPVLPAQTPAPTFTVVNPSSTATLQVSSTPAPYTKPLTSTISAQNVNLRQGPGTLFPVLDRLPNGAPVTILSKARGDDWVYVETKGMIGWVSTGFVTLTLTGKEPIYNVPVREVQAAVVVRGHVADSTGKPVDRIGFAIVKNDAGSNPPRVDAYSLADGTFYFYLPSTVTGKWTVSVVSYDCKSWIMDANCKISGHLEPTNQVITLPHKEVLEYKYVK